MRRTASLTAIGTLLLATACGGSSDGNSSDGNKASSDGGAASSRPGATVDMVFTEFVQSQVAIDAGQTVTFVNRNPITHTIVEGTYTVNAADGLRTEENDDGAFELMVSKEGESVAHTFTKAGTFQFFCTIHKGMNGTVTVR
jgi:plastocyanin